LSACSKLTEIGHGAFKGCSKLKSVDLSGCTELTVIGGDSYVAYYGAFSGCTNAVIKLPASITEVRDKAFGKDNETYCKKVLVPNEEIKQLVRASGYPGDRIEMY